MVNRRPELSRRRRRRIGRGRHRSVVDVKGSVALIDASAAAPEKRGPGKKCFR